MSRPPFIRTPPATACRSLFFSLLIKAKRFLRLPLKVGTWGTAVPRAGARPYSGGSEGWGHCMEMGLRVRSARCSAAPLQRKVSVGARSVEEASELGWLGLCCSCVGSRVVPVGNCGHWGFKIPSCSHRRGWHCFVVGHLCSKPRYRSETLGVTMLDVPRAAGLCPARRCTLLAPGVCSSTAMGAGTFCELKVGLPWWQEEKQSPGGQVLLSPSGEVDVQGRQCTVSSTREEDGWVCLC